MIWILCIFTLLCCSCAQKPQERHYTEIIVEAPYVNVPSVPAAALFSWNVPQGWRQEAGDGMRLATFHRSADPGAIDCYITTLAGPAGGLEANLGRWLGQLGFAASDENLTMLIKSAQTLTTKGALEAHIYDFTLLEGGDASAKSMLAAMITTEQTTLFVKMTGSLSALRQNKVNFFKLVKSIVRQ